MSRWLLAVTLQCFVVASDAAAISGQGTWETSLQARDADPNTPGIEAYYDTVLDITWLADANLAAQMSFGLGSHNYVEYFEGSLTWGAATYWISRMNAAQYLGANGWRLPTIHPVNGSHWIDEHSFNGSTDMAYNISAPGSVYAGTVASEMAHLHYVTLGNQGARSAGTMDWLLRRQSPAAILLVQQRTIFEPAIEQWLLD